ncbi:Sphingoid long-chain base transporter RSB1 [Trichoderma lentiforme]|uniref:Sphingoid long-chain base transporter RSB1 n=1 Tax=Trichoderma lentiforme TaxID=1567552 RepID=A0A9P5CIC8_9HYPO|nr:Sphingoid long-chain base transporter RSB1 [Trichoderma lentiforme]
MAQQDYFIHFGPNANCTLELCSIDESVYGYRPSLAANVIFAGLFTLALGVHAYLGARWKTWTFMWCLILSCLHEITGYVGRIIMWNNPWSFAGFIIQIICITQAPVFYCAAIYVTLHQTIDYFSPSLARFPTKVLIWIFVPFDVTSLALQGAGGALSASSSGSSQTGVNIALAGLILQVITLVIFCAIFGDFFFRYARSSKGQVHGLREKLFVGFLSASVLSTLVRCVFRADELKDGYDGSTVKNEGLFIGLEGVLVIFAVFCLCIGHPGFVFKKNNRMRENTETNKDVTVPLTEQNFADEDIHNTSYP